MNMQIIIRGSTSILIMTNIICFSLEVDGMNSEINENLSKNLHRPLVVRSLRRSNIRKKIAEYLFEISPSCSYTSEIAYNVKTTPTNVIGAIRGMGNRYKEDESLVGLGLVEEKDNSGKNIRFYSLTSLGKQIVEDMERRN